MPGAGAHLFPVERRYTGTVLRMIGLARATFGIMRANRALNVLRLIWMDACRVPA